MFGRLPNGCYYGCRSPGPSDCFHILGRAMLPTRRKTRKVGVVSWFGHFEARYANKSSLCNSAELCNLHCTWVWNTSHFSIILVKLIWWAEQLDGQKCMNPVCTNFALREKQVPQQHIGGQNPCDKVWTDLILMYRFWLPHFSSPYNVIKDGYRSWWYV